ncbi:30S small subunit ribosomal protein S21e [Kwoniella heveanensis CBS 569]|nr:30S small subunit ribosomal protein S21e [Kwoniella heveanensis CBS 569]
MGGNDWDDRQTKDGETVLAMMGQRSADGSARIDLKNMEYRLVTAQDHASIQIQVADVDADGKAIKGSSTPIVICGRIRAQGDSDDSINRIATKAGLLNGQGYNEKDMRNEQGWRGGSH